MLRMTNNDNASNRYPSTPPIIPYEVDSIEHASPKDDDEPKNLDGEEKRI